MNDQTEAREIDVADVVATRKFSLPIEDRTKLYFPGDVVIEDHAQIALDLGLAEERGRQPPARSHSMNRAPERAVTEPPETKRVGAGGDDDQDAERGGAPEIVDPKEKAIERDQAKAEGRRQQARAGRKSDKKD